MNLNFFRGLILFSLSLGLFACNNGPEPPTPDSHYPEEIANIILQNCTDSGCHGTSTSAAGLDLSSWDKMFEGAEKGSVCIPFEENWSGLFAYTNRTPSLGAYILNSSHQILDSTSSLAIKNWIESGAKDAEGKYYWSGQENKSVNKLFNLCAGSDLIAVSELSSNRIMRYFEVGADPDNLEAPHFIILSPDKQFLYVTLIEGGQVEKYSTTDYSFQGRVEVGSSPALLSLSPDGAYGLVSHFNADNNTPKLTMFETNGMTKVGDPLIASGDFLHSPHGITVDSDFSIAYVGAANGNYYSKITLDPTDPSGPFVDEEKIPLAPIQSPTPMGSVEFKPYQLLIDSSNNRLFISCNATNELRVFDLDTDALLQTIPVGAFPRLMANDTRTQKLFVACRDESNVGLQGNLLGCVSVVDMENMSFEKNIYQLGHIPHGIAVSEQQNWLIVSTENADGLVPPNHPILGRGGIPGHYNLIDLGSLSVMEDQERELAILPNASVLSD